MSGRRDALHALGFSSGFRIKGFEFSKRTGNAPRHEPARLRDAQQRQLVPRTFFCLRAGGKGGEVKGGVEKQGRT